MVIPLGFVLLDTPSSLEYIVLINTSSFIHHSNTSFSIHPSQYISLIHPTQYTTAPVVTDRTIVIMDAEGNRREKIIKGQKEKRVGYHGEHIPGQEGVKFILDGKTYPLICDKCDNSLYV